MQHAKWFNNNKHEACKCESNDECNSVECWQCKDSVAVGCKFLEQRMEGRGGKGKESMSQWKSVDWLNCKRCHVQSGLNSSKSEHASARVMNSITRMESKQCQHSRTVRFKCLKRREQGRRGKGERENEAMEQLWTNTSGSEPVLHPTQKMKHAGMTVMMNGIRIQCWLCQHSRTLAWNSETEQTGEGREEKEREIQGIDQAST